MSRNFTVRREFKKNDQGAIAIAAAAALPVLVGCMALAIDMGSIYLERRTAQGIVDLAAINAAQFPDDAESAARATLAANDFHHAKQISVVKGHYRSRSGIATADRFAPGVEPFNAIRVELVKDAPLAFSASFNNRPPEYSVQATAAITNTATFSVGSRLAAVRGGLSNRILGGLAGGQINLSVMDYEALLQSDVRIDDLLGALAVDLGMTAASYDAILDTDVTARTLARAIEANFVASGNGAAGAAVAKLSQQLPSSSPSFRMRTLLDPGQWGGLSTGSGQNGLTAGIDALSILRSAMLIAGGQRQVSIDLTAIIPNAARSLLTLSIGEPQQYSALASAGQPGSVVRTSQLKLRLVTETTGTNSLLGLTLRLPVYVETAYAEASLGEMTCDPDGEMAANIMARPGIARAAIADVSDSQLAAPALNLSLPRGLFLSAPLARVRASADVRLENTEASSLTFTSADVDNETIKRVGTTTPLGSLATTLLGNLTFDVEVLGLSLQTPGALQTEVTNQLRPLASPVDQVLLGALELLGVHLGEADVKVHQIRCGGAALID